MPTYDYVCEACGHEEDKLLDVQAQLQGLAGGKFRAPDFVCDQCGAAMDFDDLPERYLSFLNES